MSDRQGESRTYRWAAFTLRSGLYVSLALMIFGLLWWLAAGLPGGRSLSVGTVPLDRTISDLSSGDPLALMDLGVLALLATPALTVLAVILAYMAARQWRFAAMAALVLLILLLSIALSLNWLTL